MAEELLSLKWNNHQTHFVDILTFLREQEIFIDATLACGGKLYPTHKFVLSTCSDYFKQMFTKNPSKHPIVFMKDVSCRDLEALLDFMYNGEVNVPQSSLGSLIKTAEGLQIKGLAVPDDPPLPKKDMATTVMATGTSSFSRERRDYRGTRDNSYSPPSKRLRPLVKTPPPSSALGSCASTFSNATHPSTRSRSPQVGGNTTGGYLPLETSVADEDSRTSGQSVLSDLSPSVNSKATTNNVSHPTHVNNEESGGGPPVCSGSDSTDNPNPPSSTEPSPGPSGLHKPAQSKEEELDIKQEDMMDLGEADEGDWGGGGEGDGSLEDAGGGDSLASESAPNLSDVLGPPPDGTVNTTGDPAMGLQAYLAALRQVIPDDLFTKSRGLSGAAGKKVACPICGNIMARTYYPTHLRTHTGEKPFACPSCPYRTGDRSNLNHHMLRHKFYQGPETPTTATPNVANSQSQRLYSQSDE